MKPVLATRRNRELERQQKRAKKCEMKSKTGGELRTASTKEKGWDADGEDMDKLKQTEILSTSPFTHFDFLNLHPKQRMDSQQLKRLR